MAVKSNKKKLAQVTVTQCPDEAPKNSVSCRAANLQLLGSREEQQDRFAILNALDAEKAKKQGIFAVIADGMGGLDHGGQFAQQLVEALCQHFVDDAPDSLATLVPVVRQLSRSLNLQYDGRGGSTLVAVLLRDNQLQFLSVGDSALYLLRHDGLVQLNQPHNLGRETLQKQIRAHDIDLDRIYGQPDMARLTSFVGMRELPLLDFNTTPINVYPSDVILLCSDGLDGMISNAQIKQVLQFDPATACNYFEKLIVQANSPTQDNCTAVILHLTQQPDAPA